MREVLPDAEGGRRSAIRGDRGGGQPQNACAQRVVMIGSTSIQVESDT